VSVKPGLAQASFLSFDVFRLRDESLEGSDNFPEPDILAQEIVDDLEAALEQFREITNDLGADIVKEKEQ
jgi:type I restriction enzyme M protein